MNIREIIAELEGAAQQEAAGIHVLETTRFEPELGAVAGNCLAASRRRAEALAQAASRLRVLVQGEYSAGDSLRPNQTVAA
ncbi:MAG: hypothetical protein K2X84_09150 [Beijerinckiaceae bacterium]|nr:hypothetical protein [Beijerinckiaceae bacterium]